MAQHYHPDRASSPYQYPPPPSQTSNQEGEQQNTRRNVSHYDTNGNIIGRPQSPAYRASNQSSRSSNPTPDNTPNTPPLSEQTFFPAQPASTPSNMEKEKMKYHELVELKKALAVEEMELIQDRRKRKAQEEENLRHLEHKRHQQATEIQQNQQRQLEMATQLEILEKKYNQSLDIDEMCTHRVKEALKELHRKYQLKIQFLQSEATAREEEAKIRYDRLMTTFMQDNNESFESSHEVVEEVNVEEGQVAVTNNATTTTTETTQQGEAKDQDESQHLSKDKCGLINLYVYGITFIFCNCPAQFIHR